MAAMIRMSDGSGKSSLTVTNCSFDVGPLADPVIDLPSLPDGLHVVIDGERFVRPARFSQRLVALLQSRTGSVRIGPCPCCGDMLEYGPGETSVRHDGDEELVFCVMGS